MGKGWTRAFWAMGLLAFVGAPAFAADGATSTWFDETLSDFSSCSSHQSEEWVSSAGRWTFAANDWSACMCWNRRVYLNTGGGELVYEPCALNAGRPSSTRLASPVDALSRITVSNVTFSAFDDDDDEWSCVKDAPLAGISLRRRNDGTFSFIGWVTTRDSTCVKGRWLELAADGVVPAVDVEYDITVELDQRTIPNRVRYSVDGRALKDSIGNEWFSIRNGSLDPSADPRSCVSKVCFNGNGQIGPFFAESTAAPVARGTVEIPVPQRMQAGKTVLDATTFAYGAGLGESVAYRWHLVDAAGMEVAGSERGHGAKYTVATADYGHWVAVDVSDENGYFGTGRIWCSNLPVVYVTCFDEAGYVETDDAVAEEGKVYYWADDDDGFHPIDDLVAGADLSTNRAEHGKLFLADVETAWPTSKKEDHKAYFAITGNDAWKAQYDADGVHTTTNKKGKVSTEETAGRIHVRGNSTAGADKKPYKIKLGKKADLFGLGGGEKNKHWVLLANCFDESLMRNKICYDYSSHLGLVGMHSTWVDVVMNGKFVGNYLLCQHIRVAKERIDVHDWSSDCEEIAAAAQAANPALTDDDVDAIETLLDEQMGWMADGKFSYLGVDYAVVASGESGPDGAGGFTVALEGFSTDVTGGYVFELDAKKAGPTATYAKAPSGFVQKHAGKGGGYQFCLAMNTPEHCFTSPVVSNYVWDCWNAIGQAWSSGTGYDGKDRHYSELCDFDSMVCYWLSIYVPGNNDAARFSRYAYKDRGGKVIFGPAWDYDYGLDSLQIRISRSVVVDAYGGAHYAKIQATGWIPRANVQNFMGSWTWDPYFMYALREKYWATRPYLEDVVKDGGLIDQYVEYLGPSARANDLRWNNRIGFFGNAEETGDAAVVKEFLSKRFAWLDRQFADDVGTALRELAKTNHGGNYVRSTAIVPSVAGATAVQDSAETDLADVELEVKTAPVSVAVTVPTANAAALDVYVNGLSNGTFAVVSGKAKATIPAAALKAVGKNFLQFVAKNSDGEILANNVALLRANVPAALDVGDDAASAPAPVTTDWLDAAYAKLAAVAPGSACAGAAPNTYADYLAFAKGPSPIGKATSIWEDFVADTDPSDTNDVFTASIEIGVDGLPRVAWRPDRSDASGAVVRRYFLRGANDLATKPENWDRLAVGGSTDADAEEFRRNHAFFKVEVAMPE